MTGQDVFDQFEKVGACCAGLNLDKSDYALRCKIEGCKWRLGICAEDMPENWIDYEDAINGPLRKLCYHLAGYHKMEQFSLNLLDLERD